MSDCAQILVKTDQGILQKIKRRRKKAIVPFRQFIEQLEHHVACIHDKTAGLGRAEKSDIRDGHAEPPLSEELEGVRNSHGVFG